MRPSTAIRLLNGLQRYSTLLNPHRSLLTRMPLIIERNISAQRKTELGIAGWPTWKDGEGERTLPYADTEKTYFLTGSATLTLPGEASVTVNAGDLVIIPAGDCHWCVHHLVRRHYRSEALSPACCII